MLDHDPVVLAVGGLSLGVGRLPTCEADRELDRPSEASLNRTLLLRLKDEGACADEPEVADVRWAVVHECKSNRLINTSCAVHERKRKTRTSWVWSKGRSRLPSFLGRGFIAADTSLFCLSLPGATGIRLLNDGRRTWIP